MVAYGVVGADLHVFGDGTPVYVLENWRGVPESDPAWLRELPSRMLNARFAVVDFTGRDDELAQLQHWRRNGPRLAARWLHGPSGAGKTRLAAQFAAQSMIVDYADRWPHSHRRAKLSRAVVSISSRDRSPFGSGDTT